jgi:hypothetical protein
MDLPDTGSRHDALRKDFQITFGTENGKRVLRDLSSVCNFTSCTCEEFSAEQAFFREGQRSVFLHVLYMASNSKSSKDHSNSMEQIDEIVETYFND